MTTAAFAAGLVGAVVIAAAPAASAQQRQLYCEGLRETFGYIVTLDPEARIMTLDVSAESGTHAVHNIFRDQPMTVSETEYAASVQQPTPWGTQTKRFSIDRKRVTLLEQTRRSDITETHSLETKPCKPYTTGKPPT